MLIIKSIVLKNIAYLLDLIGFYGILNKRSFLHNFLFFLDIY
jgi:hypothetical protein